jgi:hypothetical protein
MESPGQFAHASRAAKHTAKTTAILIMKRRFIIFVSVHYATAGMPAETQNFPVLSHIPRFRSVFFTAHRASGILDAPWRL